LDGLEGLFHVRAFYVLRHLRGIVASHIHRDFPWGFDQNEVNPNLAMMVERGWPYNEDHPFFEEIVRVAQKTSGSPYVTAAQWMAHCYEGVTEAKKRGHQVISYERLCTDPDYWPAVLSFFDIEYDEVRSQWVKTTGSISHTGGFAGIKLSLKTQRRYGDRSNGAFSFLREAAGRAGTSLPMQIVESVEEHRV
jgi:hypothetical protein